jgi:hypothetical protein
MRTSFRLLLIVLWLVVAGLLMTTVSWGAGLLTAEELKALLDTRDKQELHLRLFRLRRCVQRQKRLALGRCRAGKIRARCRERVKKTAWRGCARHLRWLQKSRYQGTLTQQLQVSFLLYVYHQVMAGRPPRPPLRDFFLKSKTQKKKLSVYLEMYQRHWKHRTQEWKALQQFSRLQLRFWPQSGLKDTFRLWRLQTRLWMLSMEVTQGRFRLGLLQQSLSSFADRARREQWLQRLQQASQKTRQRWLQLQQRLEKVERRLKKQEGHSERGLNKLQQLERIQGQLRRNLKKLRSQWKRLSTQKRRIRGGMQRLHEELKQEWRQSQPLRVSLSEPAPVRVVNRWQRCDLQKRRFFLRRQRIGGGLFWGGVSAVSVGLGGGGLGTFLYLDSFDSNRYRPAQASHQRGLSTIAFATGGSLVVLGGAMLLSTIWVLPNRRERIRAMLRCPPRRLFPSSTPMAASLIRLPANTTLSPRSMLALVTSGRSGE